MRPFGLIGTELTLRLFLTHLCPVCLQDAGGNAQSGSFCGRKGRKLHQIWDSDMITRRLNEPQFGGNNATYLSYLLTQLKGQFASKVDAWRACPSSDQPYGACSSVWAQESIELACSYAYVDETGARIRNGFDLGEAYYESRIPVIEQQMIKGGVRLANVLNQIFSKGMPLEPFTLPPAQFAKWQREQRQKGSIAFA